MKRIYDLCDTIHREWRSSITVLDRHIWPGLSFVATINMQGFNITRGGRLWLAYTYDKIHLPTEEARREELIVVLIKILKIIRQNNEKNL